MSPLITALILAGIAIFAYGLYCGMTGKYNVDREEYTHWSEEGREGMDADTESNFDDGRNNYGDYD